MRTELAYLVILLAACAVVLFLLGTGKVNKPLVLNSTESRHLTLYGSAWIGGVLGGCVFSIKWLYHSIARGKWHLDRRPWRFLTPLMSGALAFATMTLLISGVIPIFNTTITGSQAGVTGVSFIIGYFSDNTVAALAAAADRILGTKTNLRDRRE